MAKTTVARRGNAGEEPALKRGIQAAKCVDGKPATVEHIDWGAVST